MLVKINWKPSRSELRKFGVTMVIAGLLIGGLLLWKGKMTVALVLFGGGAFIAMTAFVAPAVALVIYKGWMSVALVMGTVVLIAIFTVTFNLIVDILYAVIDPRVRYD